MTKRVTEGPVVEFRETIDGRWMVVANGYQWGPTGLTLDLAIGAHTDTWVTRTEAEQAWREAQPPKPLKGWAVYGSLPEERYQLMRTRGAARWWDGKVGCWIGPEQRNVAPAVAWALAFEEAPEGLRAQIVGAPRVSR